MILNEIQNRYYEETGENWLNSQNEPDIDYVAWLEKLVSKTDHLPNVSEWVAVDERLPEHGEQVLTFTPDSEATYQLQRIITFGSMQSGFPSGVTHWRPLPEPPCR